MYVVWRIAVTQELDAYCMGDDDDSRMLKAIFLHHVDQTGQSR
jgi:hypothetical protein